MNFKERLHEAGTKFDGHVTNGSIEAQMELVLELLHEIKSEFKNAGDFGDFDNDKVFPETIAIELMKGVAQKHGIEL